MTSGIYVRTEETRKKLGLSHLGIKSHFWKGDNAGYFAMHKWVSKWKGCPSVCEVCGTTTAKRYEWANVDHTYKRILEDYIRMCVKCHRNYDKNRGVKIC